MKQIELLRRKMTEYDSFDLAVELGFISLAPKRCVYGRQMHIERGKVRHGVD